MLILSKPFDFPDKNPVNYPTAKEMRDLLRPKSKPMGNAFYFYISSLLIYRLKIHKATNIASDEHIMENNYMFVMLWN